MIVEDDAFHQKLLSYQLTKNGYQVMIANDGLAALDWLRSAAPQPDLIVMDQLMPRLSGLEVLKAIKESSVQLPVVLMSAAAWPYANEAATQPQPDAFFTKPFQLEKLVATIEELLQPAAMYDSEMA
ncbi:response regulator [Larkinella insperata]|uniref:Response regulator n=1 Tax=Larkinella insperata TaxID=332158 RepID=A0ABW3Q6X3_9BACT